MAQSDNREFEKGSSILFILMMGANVVNYLFQIVTGRMLDVVVYGELNTLMSILTFAILPTAAFNLVVSKYVTEYDIRGLKGKAWSFICYFSKFVVIVSGLILLLGFAGADIIAGFVHIQDERLVIGIFIIAAIATFSSIALGGLQGIKEFLNYGIVNLILPIIKIVGSVLLLWCGMELYGVLGAMAIGYILTVMIGLVILKAYFRNIKVEKSEIKSREILRYCLGSFVVNAGLSFFTNIDVVLIKHYFLAHDAGLYSSAAVLAKMILYVSSSITVALFPMAVENARSGQGYVILRKAYIYGGGLSIAAAVALNILRRPMINILYGEKYSAAVQYIPILSLMIVILSFVSIVINYRLALGKIKPLSISVLFAIIAIMFLVMIFHQSVYSIILTMSVVLFCVLVFNVSGVRKQKT